MKYVVLVAIRSSYGSQSVLVDEETFIDEGRNPSNFFKPALADHAVKVGEVDIVGVGVDHIDPVYTSE